mgnify:CR=1 FL=1|tara:strand:+ start:3539 stop:4453 length:915 start_codon:yes stop_codon:yes gene_type:complete
MNKIVNLRTGLIAFSFLCFALIYHFIDKPEYDSTSRLYIKQENQTSTGFDIASISSSLGINLEDSFSIESNPHIYPTILTSSKFIFDILNVIVDDSSLSDYLKNNYLSKKDNKNDKVANEKLIKLYREDILSTYVERKNLVVVVTTTLDSPEKSQKLNHELLSLLNIHLAEIKLKDIKDKLYFLNQSLKTKVEDLDVIDNQILDFREKNVGDFSPSLQLELEKLLRNQRSIEYSRLNLQNQIEFLKIEEFDSKMPIQILDNPSYPLKRSNTLWDKIKIFFLLGLSIELMLFYRKDILKIVGYLD